MIAGCRFAVQPKHIFFHGPDIVTMDDSLLRPG